ncbi:MAG: hypothetical protein AAFN40_20360 [Cyanobacteria bacterium J06560_6]
MRFSVRIVRWILSVLFVLPILLNLTTILDGDWILNAILLAIATALVLPVLDPVIAKKLSPLKVKALRIFLTVVLAIAAFVIGATPALTVQSIVICTPDNTADCANKIRVFAAGVQPVTIQTQLESKDAASMKKVAIDIRRKDVTEQGASLFSEPFELDGKPELKLDIEDVVLDVGLYEVVVTPLEGLAKRVTFAVLPSSEDAASRTRSDREFTDFRPTISELLVCPDPGGEDHCEETLTTISSSIPVLADAVVSDANASYSWLGEGPEITFTWREYAEDTTTIPEIMLQDTLALGRNTGVVGYPLGIADEGLPPGKYDVVAVLETVDSQPLRVVFTVTE